MKFIIFLIFLLKIFTNDAQKKSFVIDYENDQFLKDGRPFRYIAGSMHYFRIPHECWHDRLMKLKAAGLNAVQTYVAWNVHEPREHEYFFEDHANLFKFLQLAHDLDLAVILRTGPYICAEIEFGGLPWWLLKTPNIGLRSSDPRFLALVQRWYDKLLPMLQPFLYKNGGPVISMQVENEYGSLPLCDRNYTNFLHDLFRSYVGYDFVLFTTDGGDEAHLRCGYIEGVYPTVDFGVTDEEHVRKSFAAQRKFATRGPLVNSEFYAGWLDLWGRHHSTVDTSLILETIGYMYGMGASFSIYMFHGGSNFGYMNGADWTHNPSTQSYDYDAPLDESGNPTSKYFAIKHLLTALAGNRINLPVPSSSEKISYGETNMKFLGKVTDLLDMLCPTACRVRSRFPQTMEQLDFGYGYVLYETKLKRNVRGYLRVPGINDRGYVMVNGYMRGLISINGRTQLHVHTQTGNVLQILVENMGRINMGPRDPKGIVGQVWLDDEILEDWIMYPLSLENIFDLNLTELSKIRNSNLHKSAKSLSRPFSPSIYYGTFPADIRGDTFFNPDGWTKGQFFINNFNIGRYWPDLGPQVTLYVSKFRLKSENRVIMLELEMAGNCHDLYRNDCSVWFDDQPFLNKTFEYLN